jgi:hypothetical protein
MDTKALVIKIDAEMHKEIKRIALEQNTSIQKIFERHNFEKFVDKIIGAEKIERT